VKTRRIFLCIDRLFSAGGRLLGASSDVTAIGNTRGGGNYDVDAGQSLRFSVAAFDGFTGVAVMEPNGGNSHLLILGEGTGLAGKEFDTPNKKYSRIR
jgi:hypothetical protein